MPIVLDRGGALIPKGIVNVGNLKYWIYVSVVVYVVVYVYVVTVVRSWSCAARPATNEHLQYKGMLEDVHRGEAVTASPHCFAGTKRHFADRC